MVVQVHPSDLSAVLTLAAAPISASPSHVGWSDDGQLAITTDADIHILTPAEAYSVDRDHAIDAGPSLDSKGKGKARAVPVFKTKATISRSVDIDWSEHSNDWTNLTAPSDDLRWRSAVWSPTGLNPLGGCYMAALTNRHQTVVLGPKKNAHRDEWQKLFNISRELMRENIKEHIEDMHVVTPDTIRIYDDLVRAVTKSQTTAAKWSGALPSGSVDGSLLGVGSRAARVTLWRLVGDGEMVKVADFEPLPDVIIDLAWSPWRATGEGYVASLAVAGAGGQLNVVEVVRAADGAITVGASRPLATGDSLFHQMSWVVVGEQSQASVLVGHRVGEVVVCTAWPGSINARVIELPVLAACEWEGTNVWDPCSGIWPLASSDSAVVSLTCGLFYVIGNLSTSPAIDIAGSQALSMRVRGYFRMLAHEDARPVSKIQCMRTFASNGDDAVPEILVLFQSWEPSTLRNTSRAVYYRSTFFGAALESRTGSPSAAERLVKALQSPEPVLRVAPTRQLQHVLTTLAARSLSTAAVEPLMAVLRGTVAADSLAMQSTGDAADQAQWALFSNPTVNSLRLRLVLCTALSRRPNSATDGLQALTVDLTQRVLRYLEQTMHTAFRLLELDDRARSLVNRFSHASRLGTAASTNGSTPAAPPAEPCPACSRDIPFTDSRLGVCESGHVWDRCAVTLEVITTLETRTCTLCARKALMPPKPTKAAADADAMDVVEDAPRSSPVEVLLKTAKVCLFCGGRWTIN